MKKTQNFTIVGLAMSLMLFMLALVAFGQQPVPTMMNYQGRLCDTATAEPVPDANYSVTFRIYNDETSGTLLWSETQSVSTKKGVFGVLLGGTNPISLSFDEAYWFSVQISGEPESARNPIVSVGYAFRSEYSNDRYTDGEARNAADDITSWGHSDIVTNLNADMLDGLHASSFLTTASDFGRSGVASILYEGTTALSGKYLGIAATAANADMLDGQDGAYYLNWNYLTNVPAGFADDVDNTGITAESDTLDSVCSRGSSTSRSITVNGEVTCNLGQANGDWACGRLLVDRAGDNLCRITQMSGGGGYLGTYGPNGNYNIALTSLSGYNNHGYIAVKDSSGNTQAGMYVNSSGQGVVYGDTKSFRMVNTAQPGTEIWYTCPEGPEAAAYVRGTGRLTNGRAEITLPDHFVAVASTQGITVQVTPLSGDSKGLAVVEKAPHHFAVQELAGGTGTYDFDYMVMAVRQRHENYQVIRSTSEAALAASAESNG
jgi:hypothetical protein